MRARIATITTTLGLLGMAVALGACSADDQAQVSSETDTVSTDGGSTGSGSTDGGEGAAYDGDEGSASTDGETVLTALGQQGPVPGRAIIRDVTVRLEVDDPAAAVDEITTTARRVGGFVAEADLQRVDTERRTDLLQGTLTLRVPADRLDEAVSAIGKLSTVPPETSISTRDVTSQLVDVEARLTNLRALEAELRGFLADARQASGATPDTVLRVFNEVSNVRGQIEQLEAQQTSLQDLVALATLRVELRPAIGAAAVVPDGWSPGGVLRSAARATVTAAQAVANVAIWLAVFVLPIGALAAVPFVAYRWLRQRAARSAA